VLVTDKLKSYAAAKREIMPRVEHASITGPKTPLNRPDDASGS
jgi:transposase-like protein